MVHDQGNVQAQTGRAVSRFRRHPRVALAAVVAALLLAAGAVAYGVHRHRVRAGSLVTLGGTERQYADGRGVKIVIAGNANDRTSVVFVSHYGTPDPARQRVRPFLSGGEVKAHSPPDPDASGLWVDGRKRRVGDALTVIYMSEKLAATDVSIPEGEQPRFLDDARQLDPLRFVEKWITPRLDSPPA